VSSTKNNINDSDSAKIMEAGDNQFSFLYSKFFSQNRKNSGLFMQQNQRFKVNCFTKDSLKVTYVPVQAFQNTSQITTKYYFKI